ncbi:malonate decarboxylase holo-ACP synthase [Nonomuraea salmonea]|uniref:Malonate decarboxylase holo-ACP synthase n=1 Tax=Nonomuraea salmonea TaxID=46181 RepID=A0ABV5P177_9ACTN
MTARPHDLLRLADGATAGAGLPGWAAASLSACGWAVVRRAPHPPGLIPIGVRGPQRSQRHAAFVPRGEVIGRVRPEELTHRPPREAEPPAALPTALPTARRAAMSVPASAALPAALWDTLSAVGLRLAEELGCEAVWGPVGSVGFELATGHQVTHPASDLDLLVRTPHRLPPATAARLVIAFAALPSRVDCRLETPGGGVALAEWARTGGPVLARTAHGPELVDDPWARP